nr:toprim domain-containing protein [Pseudomonas aeruginosa]
MPRIDYERLLNSVSIDDVANRLGMTLIKTSAYQFKTLCPFHDDKSPSLLIDTNRSSGRQHYYCFACGAHGDVIDLVKEQLNLDFKNAVEWLDPTSQSSAIRNKSKILEKKNLPIAISHSALQFGLNLYKKLSDENALEKWITERNLDPAILQRAGYVYAHRNALSNSLYKLANNSTKREYIGDLEDAFLLRKIIPGVTPEMHLPFDRGIDSHNRYCDFFIGERVIFPIHDEGGRLLGLAGRSASATSEATTPKYQFTREFPKATVLYRADYAFKRIRSEAKRGTKNINLYVCEGFFDALRFESLGLPAVAVMGSSLSEKQLQLIHSLSNALPKDVNLTIVISFDRDEAGLRGAADACLKLIQSAVECAFLWPTTTILTNNGNKNEKKDPDEYLAAAPQQTIENFLAASTYPAELAVLAYSFGVTAEDVLHNEVWEGSPRSRRYRALNRATSAIEKATGSRANSYLSKAFIARETFYSLAALNEWKIFANTSSNEKNESYSESYLSNAEARLNHSRILAYMGSRRGELPCDEPRWERLDIAATAFNSLLTDRLSANRNNGPIGPYNAVWVPRAFGGEENRLKLMPLPEDLIIQQYLLNEILTERWDHEGFGNLPFSRFIPAVRYYREERRSVTTGFDNGNGIFGELKARTLSYAYQIDMDVLEGRQPATDQGMYRPFSECWRDFMTSLTEQAKEIGYVYSIRLDVKRYYDRLRRHIVRDRILFPLQLALSSVTGETPGFAQLLNIEKDSLGAEGKAAAILDRLDEHLFGVHYAHPDTGLTEETQDLIGIPQGPVLSAWIGSIALFPVDEEAQRLISTYNSERRRIGYARYVDDIVILADDPTLLAELRSAIDQRARKLQLVLLAKAEEIPAMHADDFSAYINKGRALAAYGPAWEPPLVGDGESGWDFWSVAPATDRQSALHLLHNVELYKASKETLLQTVKTAFNAPDLRASELSKAARLIWYAVAVENLESKDSLKVLSKYLEYWSACTEGTAWRLQPERNKWESPILFALEGLEHLIDKQSRDISELSATENSIRRSRIKWLADLALSSEFESHVFNSVPAPQNQLDARFKLIRWKASRLVGKNKASTALLLAERSKPVKNWEPFEWMHEAVTLLSEAPHAETDPLTPFVEPAKHQKKKAMSGFAAEVFNALLPSDTDQDEDAKSEDFQASTPSSVKVALQTIASIVPKENLAICLSRRPHLIWGATTKNETNRLILPPLPGIGVSKLLSCTGPYCDSNDLLTINTIEALDFSSPAKVPEFLGSNNNHLVKLPTTDWKSENFAGELIKHKASIPSDHNLRLRIKIPPVISTASAKTLKQAASLYRAIAQIISTYSEQNPDLELVPAWPYIAADANSDFYYLIAESVDRSELGNRAFVRDGGRALRTAEVPIYEASLWRVGVAISDYLGLYDDFTKFSGADSDVILDEAAIANPARYVLRTQLRKLRGTYADSKISKRRSDDGLLPATVARALRLLETFPEQTADPLDQVLHVLAAEAESSGMYLAFRESWSTRDTASFLRELTDRVLRRLPLSVGQNLRTEDDLKIGLRRDLVGALFFARRLFSVKPESPVFELPAWKALCAGFVSTGIAVAFEGLIASLRSHGSFERYPNFDFPEEWGVISVQTESTEQENTSIGLGKLNGRTSLLQLCHTLVQHLGHRLNQDNLEHISPGLLENLKFITQQIALIESYDDDQEPVLEWPFDSLSNNCFALLNLELLESTAAMSKQLDFELGFETASVIAKSYGYNPQNKRFTDSRSGVQEVTPWMISQFPLSSKHIEEVTLDGRFFRIWTEVFDRKTGKLLSVSALGEPFASIAINKELSDNNISNRATESPSGASDQARTEDTRKPDHLSAENTHPQHLFQTEEASASDVTEETQSDNIGNISPISESLILTSTKKELISDTLNTSSTTINQSEFRKNQSIQWANRSENGRSQGLVRVALLQADFDLTYKHPFVEACPTHWPFNSKISEQISKIFGSDTNSKYWPLLKACETNSSGHNWASTGSFPSWSEHRRQSILRRVVDTCKSFGVDLLILPEYSVRPETITWLKSYLSNSSLSVLAGTYINVKNDHDNDHLTAPLTLLWPLPKELSKIYTTSLRQSNQGSAKDYDALQRGHVVEISRNKKYRSIALDEFFKPHWGPLKPLFNPNELARHLEDATGYKPSTDVISHLLSETRLPLKYLLELICSEVFLVSSPANYQHMGEDLRAMWRRFGLLAEKDEVAEDIKALSSSLSITGDGKIPRRSILAVPAATSRSADYWFAGQAGFLAAGTTTVFCNSIDGKSLVGGSCFIGRGSWKSEDSALGYISNLTPYHGWSKGIYYNNINDTLSKNDQALVICDIDPHNMLEGKPRAQTMPSPLQLVGYLPLIETADWAQTQESLLRTLSLSLPESLHNSKGKVKSRPLDEVEFWKLVTQTKDAKNEELLDELWSKFPDPISMSLRANSYKNNSYMQPTASKGSAGIFTAPALYDWIDVSLTLTDQQELPTITIHPWKIPQA